MASKRKKEPNTTDAVQILYDEFYKDHPKRLAALHRERLHAKMAQVIYELRTESGLTQRQLAEFAGTSHSQISRIEDSDYDGHSLTTLCKIAAVFGALVEVRFRPTSPRRKSLNAPSGKRIRIPEAVA